MGLLTPVAVRIGAIPWMPKLLPQIVAVDKTVQRLSKGRLSVLDGGWLVAGSYFGDERMPQWVANLRATDAAEIAWRGKPVPVTWREVQDEERARLWRVMLRTWPNFARYEQRTGRLIPVFLLERATQP